MRDASRPDGNRPAADIEREFHRAMVAIYHNAKKQAGYNATYFLRMVSEQGGLEAARNLLHATRPSEGFTALWERGRLDLTVEALVLQPGFEPLFTEDEREISRSRLNEYGYRPR